MQFGTCEDEVQLYLDARYICSCESTWSLYVFHMHEESPPVVRLQVYLPGEDLISWNEDEAPDLVLPRLRLGADSEPQPSRVYAEPSRDSWSQLESTLSRLSQFGGTKNCKYNVD